MKSAIRKPSSEPGALIIEALQAARALGIRHDAPVLLGYHPVLNTNPFARLLYGQSWDLGIAPIPVPNEEQIVELAALARQGHRVVLHLHWLNRPLGAAETPEEAAAGGARFLALLDEVHEAGVRIAWTVHNLLPHSTRFEAQERVFRGAVANRADVIHVMAAATPELVAPYFELPRERIMHVPHPSYTGAYADHIGRDQARHDLGLLPDELVYLVLGAIRPYKGIPELLDAWDDLPRDGVPRRLLIAGRPTHDPGIDRLLERAALHPDVLLHPDLVQADDMQVFLRAADVAVLPYLRALNSGALMLAMSFDLPAIVPAGGGFAEVVDGRNGLVFDGNRRSSLVDALARAGAIAGPDGRLAARETAARFDPATMSRQFALGLLEKLAWR